MRGGVLGAANGEIARWAYIEDPALHESAAISPVAARPGQAKPKYTCDAPPHPLHATSNARIITLHGDGPGQVTRLG